MTIALLCPTKGRPAQCKRMIESVCRTKSDDTVIEIITGRPYDLNDSYEIGEMCKAATENAPCGPCHKKQVYISQLQVLEWPTTHSWNYLAEVAMANKENKLFMLAADDMVFTTPEWDKALLEAYDYEPHVYSFQDSRDKNGTPHPIVTREWIEKMGWAFPPIFLHWFLDSWTVEIAKANTCFTHLKDFMLEHRKPSDEGKPDATHSGIRQLGWHDRDKWVNEHCQDVLEMYKRKLAG